jgi:hypothetical protein
VHELWESSLSFLRCEQFGDAKEMFRMCWEECGTGREEMGGWIGMDGLMDWWRAGVLYPGIVPFEYQFRQKLVFILGKGVWWIHQIDAIHNWNY